MQTSNALKWQKLTDVPRTRCHCLAAQLVCFTDECGHEVDYTKIIISKGSCLVCTHFAHSPIFLALFELNSLEYDTASMKYLNFCNLNNYDSCYHGVML